MDNHTKQQPGNETTQQPGSDTTQQPGNDRTAQPGNGTTPSHGHDRHRQPGNAPHRLAIIIGSVREGRFGPTVASWVAGQARAHGGFEVDVIDLAEIDIPLALPAAPPKYAGDSYPRPAGMRRLTEALERADAFIVVTPEYNHSYPASLKAAIDWHFTQWTAKPVAFVSYGGAAGGRHAVLHLENVLTELHAVTIRDGLAFPNYFTAWQDGRPLDDRTEGYAKTLLDQLSWWAGALSAARKAVPYPA